MRDNGPIFFKDTTNNSTKIMSFPWTTWGHRDHEIEKSSEYDESIAGSVAKELGYVCEKAPFASEGGDREFNGKGSLIVCKEVELDRNPGKSQSELESLFKQQFNVTNVIWLNHCLADDTQSFYCPIPNTDIYTCQGTGGHVDEFARFVSPTTILLAEVHKEELNTPLGVFTHQRLEENFKILSSLKDQDGQPFQIIRLPLPPPIIRTITCKDPIYEALKNLQFKSGIALPDKVQVVAATSYCNFLVSNGVVLLPKYYQDGRSPLFKETDDTSKQILEKIYPDRRVIQISAERINLGGGGIHCITQHQPI